MPVVGAAQAFLLASCISYEAIPLNRIADRIEPGDHVYVTTVDGKRRDFMVRAVEPGLLIGSDERVDLAEVDLLERRSLDLLPTAELAAGTFLVGTALLFLAVYGFTGYG